MRLGNLKSLLNAQSQPRGQAPPNPSPSASNLQVPTAPIEGLQDSSPTQSDPTAPQSGRRRGSKSLTENGPAGVPHLSLNKLAGGGKGGSRGHSRERENSRDKQAGGDVPSPVGEREDGLPPVVAQDNKEPEKKDENPAKEEDADNELDPQGVLDDFEQMEAESKARTVGKQAHLGKNCPILR